MRRCRKQNSLGQAAFIIGVEVWHLGTNDNGDAGGRTGQMACVCAVDSGELRQNVTITDNHEFPGLTVAGAARPTRNFQNVVQDRLGKRVGSELAYGAQAAQKCNPRGRAVRSSGVQVHPPATRSKALLTSFGRQRDDVTHLVEMCTQSDYRASHYKLPRGFISMLSAGESAMEPGGKVCCVR